MIARAGRALLVGVALASAQTQYPETVPKLLNNYCVACHNAKTKTANLDLERLKDPKIALAERDVWESVAERLKSGQMPPPPIPKPPADQVAAALQWAETHIESMDRSRKVDPGRVTARRLNRVEYNNTIRDLLAISFRPADDFPLDDSGHGFDNIGDVLSLNPNLMEKYLNAADQIVRLAIVSGPAPKPVLEKYDIEKIGPTKTVPADPEGPRLITTGALTFRHRFPRDADYDLRVFVRGRGVPQEPHSELAVFLDSKQVGMLQIQPGTDRRRTFDLRIQAPAGEHLLTAAFTYPGPAVFDPPPNDPRNRTDLILFVDTLEIRGPFIKEGELPDSHKRIFLCRPTSPSDEECARRIITSLARRAWRRPVTSAETGKLLAFHRMAVKDGEPFESGIQLALKAILASPHFLFRIERDPAAGSIRELNSHELASRLSYFLWSSMPDDELFRFADRDELRSPEALAAQVRRMIADPKANALAENFAGQWLELRNLSSVSPDPKRFPEFDADLKEAMRRETQLFFSSVLREDRPILDFLDGKFSFLNERLAKHYSVPNVTGRQFQRIDLSGNAQRSGILTHASVLTVTSYPTRTSPVLRGLWVLENFLASPPPPPPANVPSLQEERIGKDLSLRQQLERHRADPSCAVCHNKMDALGFGLENYDATGAWRSHDGNFPVDAAGVLPGNHSFATPSQMKTILRDDSDLFTRCLTEKMLTYALGRGLESSDKPLLRSISKKVAASGHKFSNMIIEVVQSPAFRMRRGDAAIHSGGLQ